MPYPRLLTCPGMVTPPPLSVEPEVPEPDNPFCDTSRRKRGKYPPCYTMSFAAVVPFHLLCIVNTNTASGCESRYAKNTGIPESLCYANNDDGNN